jgi:hypothetical protein
MIAEVARLTPSVCFLGLLRVKLDWLRGIEDLQSPTTHTLPRYPVALEIRVGVRA